MTDAHLHFLDIHPEVSDALARRLPVVALESTIIAHGMPYPQNVETATAVENAVRNAGAVPATIAIIAGRIKVGLAPDHLMLLGLPDIPVEKCSRRDIPVVVARKLHGATTVAGTMCIAYWTGIRVFATGGIGGVHRGAGQSFDISADLQELAQADVAVVSAGAKAILDIGHTLEYLETHGVPVLGYRTGSFPAFYTRDSGFPVDARVDSASELAHMIDTKWKLGLHGGVLIANPIPEEYALNFSDIDAAIDRAVEECAQQGITGKAITPYLLARIGQLTDGASLESNIQLVLNNATLAGELAVELAKI